uniref:Translocon-associated protein subunit alpha n=1 Tax=Pavo cristatus TaxID=9049 RepID=A0A8C9L7K9_PAVCR
MKSRRRTDLVLILPSQELVLMLVMVRFDTLICMTEEKEEEDLSGEPKASPSADTTILFVKGEDFPANNIVKFLVGFTNKGTEDFIVESLDASFRYPQDYQFYIQNFTALPLNTVVPPQRQATFEYSFIPAEPMGGRPFGLVINLNYRDANVSTIFTDLQRTSAIQSKNLAKTCFLTFQRKRPVQKVEMGTSNQNDVDMSWIPQETLNQINKASPRRLPRKRAQKRSVGSDE